MKPLSDVEADTFERVRFVLTDMDETLTYRGRLSAQTYGALERLEASGIIVIPVTAAPAGWCDQMARMWPVAGVIGENGGLFIRRQSDGHGAIRQFWIGSEEDQLSRLTQLRKSVQGRLPHAEFADDQPFRMATLAFRASPDEQANRSILETLGEVGASATENNLWVLGWLDGFDKLKMASRVLQNDFGISAHELHDLVVYVGDSTNDAPMFGFFKHTVGVSTVRRYLHDIPIPPAWVTQGPGGEGFVEVADAVIAAVAGSGGRTTS